MKSLWTWALARSKDSLTHLWANVVIFASSAFEMADLALSLLDPDINAQIVTVVGDLGGVHIAARVGLGLMLVTKMARDRKVVPFTDAEPHSPPSGSEEAAQE
jgi:hypothetical protein